MTPFDSLLFFYILIVALIPAVVLGLAGKPIKYYGSAITLVFLLLIFNSPQKLLFLLIYYLLELLLVKTFLLVRSKTDKRYVLWLFLLFSLLPMVLVKFNIELFGSRITLLGLSYLTFRTVQVLVDTYDGLIEKISVWEYSYFLLFFPTISSGPIDRSRRFCKELQNQPDRQEYINMLQKGVWKLFTGIFYNFIISGLIYTYWMAKLPATGLLNDIWYMYAYTFFLFFNFAGYSQMAIGTSYILGVKLPENFDMPFISRDLKEFWARWHISLSTWLRDYVYSRFVMTSLKKKWFKNPYTGSYIAYIITMMTMGVWHGFHWHYIVYGAYHGILMCINDILDNKWKRFKKLKRDPKWQPLFILITFHLIAFGLLIFSGRLF